MHSSELSFNIWPVWFGTISLLIHNSKFLFNSSFPFFSFLLVRIVKPRHDIKLFCLWSMEKSTNHSLNVYITKISFSVKRIPYKINLHSSLLIITKDSEICFVHFIYIDFSRIVVKLLSSKTTGFPFILLAFFAFATSSGKLSLPNP